MSRGHIMVPGALERRSSDGARCTKMEVIVRRQVGQKEGHNAVLGGPERRS